jgi:integrase/recombinase XerD
MAKPPNLLRKVKIEDKWLLLPVVRNKIVGGEQRFDLTRVMHRGSPVVATAGTFYLEYHEGKKKRRAIGDDHRQVKAALATQASVLGLRAMGVAADDAPQLRPRSTVRLEGKTIRSVVDAFVVSPPPEYRHKSYLKYRNALESFAAWTKKTHCIEIERDDIKAFVGAQVRQQGLDVSTAKDKAVAVAKILRDQGAPIVMRKGDWPRVTRRQREIYKPEILKKLFAAADEEEYVLFQTFLLTGMREQEVSYLYWTDFEANEGTLDVSKKPGFDPKNYEERTVPVHDELVALLEKHRRRQDGKQLLIFPTSRHNVKRGAPGGQADGHMLRRLKNLAFRAGLNCGRCEGKLNKKPAHCRTHPICQEFGLHKFRHTYATTMLQDGVDLVSLQKLLGHKDLDSTREYLRALEPNDLRKKILKTSLATRFV